MRKIVSLLLILALVLASFSMAFADTTYVVKSGDTLAKIAAKYSMTYKALGDYNKLKNFNLIRVNQKLLIPSKTAAVTPAKPAAPASPAAPAAPTYKPVVGSTMVLASTTSTQDTGLFDVLIPAFDKKYGTKTKVIAVGSGEAMAMGERGDADVLLVHSRAAEDTFVEKGFGVNRMDVMYNFYVIVGPKEDPAKVKALTNASEAFKAIADSKSTFLSRADKSGTNTKELAIWKKAAVTPVAANDKWYLETGKGMGDTLTMANEMKGYTLTDSGTWGTMKDKLTNLELVLQGDSILFNPYGVIAINPDKYPNANYQAAMAFATYITSAEGQKLIKEYKTKAGQNVFVPNAK